MVCGLKIGGLKGGFCCLRLDLAATSHRTQSKYDKEDHDKRQASQTSRNVVVSLFCGSNSPIFGRHLPLSRYESVNLRASFPSHVVQIRQLLTDLVEFEESHHDPVVDILAQGSGFRIWGFGFRVSGERCRV